MKKNKNDLLVLTSKEVNELFEKHQKDKIWSFYEEREFVENLFNQRFNYLILMYSLFITAAATVDNKQNLLIILCLGIVFSILVSLTIYRAYVKLIIYLKILHKLPNQVFEIVQKEIDAMKCTSLFPVNHITGIYIPLICILTLILGLILTICDVIKP